MQAAKIIGVTVGGSLALAGAALLAAWLLIDPNDYRAALDADVFAATGRPLTLTGDLRLSLLPWLAVTLGPGSMGNPVGFQPADGQNEPFLTFRRAAVRLRLWPLLARRLEVAGLAIDGLTVNLARDAAGIGNWQGFGHEALVGSADAAPGAAGPAMSAAWRHLGGLELTHARVHYGPFDLWDLGIESGSRTAGGSIPVSIAGTASRGKPDESAQFTLQAEAMVDPARSLYRLAGLRVNALVSLPNRARPARTALDVPELTLDAQAQTLVAPALEVTVSGAQLRGSVRATELGGTPRVSGQVSLAPLLLREFLPRWGVALPATRSARALTQVRGSATYECVGPQLLLSPLDVQVDDTHVTGRASHDFESEATTFALTADHLDLSGYLPPVDQAAPQTGPEPAAGHPGPPTPWNLDGTLALKRLQSGSLVLEDLQAALSSHAGVLRVHPLTASLDGGAYSGDVVIDRNEQPPRVSLDEHLSGVDLARLLASPRGPARLTGRATLSLTGTGHGVSVPALVRTLEGRLDGRVSDGALEGLDLGFQLARARAWLHAQTTAQPDTHRTHFETLQVSLDVKDGLATVTTLEARSPALAFTGEGHVDLVRRELDLALLADTLESLGAPLKIPVAVTGSIADPKVRPDFAAVAKGPLKEQIKDALKDKLRSLLGR